MITDIRYIKKVDGIAYYFDYTTEGKNKAIKYGGRRALDGLEWIYENKSYVLLFEEKDFPEFYLYENNFFTRYNGISPSHPAPDNLVLYKPTGEIEKIITTPLLPDGKRGAGFYQIGRLSMLQIPKGFENCLFVSVWEDERSPWVYEYFFNPVTYEFTYYNRSYR